MKAGVLSPIIVLENLFSWFLTAQAPYEWGWRMHPMWTWGWGMLMMALVFVISGIAIYAGMMGVHRFFDQSKKPPTDSAMDILRKRFARGEIDKDEFETKKKALTK